MMNAIVLASCNNSVWDLFIYLRQIHVGVCVETGAY